MLFAASILFDRCHLIMPLRQSLILRSSTEGKKEEDEEEEEYMKFFHM